MSTQVRLFQCAVEDNYGIPSPEAIVAIRECSVTSQETLTSKDSVEGYTEELTVNLAAYKVSYWHSQETKAKGFDAKPLFQEVDGEVSDVFVVDLQDAESVRILNENLPSREIKLKLATADFIRKSKG